MKKIVLAIMLVLGFGLTNASAYENTPEGVILAFLEAAKNGNIDKMVSYMDKNSFFRINRKTGVKFDDKINRAEGIYDKLKSSTQDIKQWKFKIKKGKNYIDGYSVYYKNPTYIEKHLIHSEDGWGIFSICNVEKINGIWKIVMF